ncbi:ankyrin repeat domain-containing protein [Burkholderia plantarii]|uniref:ankyrin repeat domain-containing protein n=1 Tax=Burkholderia plantarii TaxID=41899 RepID=UPI0018DBFB58|nr:ankyrin repeat domain-containing protein [Burkholderia plantarii]MBI0325478.1 ankyrin repeat domain-containing protein [Burkholderia plantarii]
MPFRRFSAALVKAVLPALLVSLGACAAPELHKPEAGATVQDIHHYDDDWFAAARLGRTDILDALLQAGYPIDAVTSRGYTALILTAYDAQPEAMAFLLAHGANACVGDRNGNTALMGAIFKGELDIARRLMTASCPIDQVNNAGETALSFAALFGRLDLLPELVKLGADPDHADARGTTALRLAQQQGNQEAYRALLTVGASR